MPDYDIIHGKFKRHWKKFSDSICEWTSSKEEIAYIASQSLKGEIQEYGNEPVIYIHRAASRFSDILSSQENNTVNWGLEISKLDKLAISLMGHQRGMNLAERVSLRRMGELAEGHNMSNCHLRLAKDYVAEVYKANSTLIFPMAGNQGLSYSLIQNRLTQVYPLVLKSVNSYASQLIRHKGVEKLRLPPSPKPAMPDLYQVLN